jgi:hypothetical protein
LNSGTEFNGSLHRRRIAAGDLRSKTLRATLAERRWS